MILDWEHQVTGPGYTGISQGLLGSEIRAKLPYSRTIQSVLWEQSGSHPSL
jgi:hypothetical protein